MNEALLQQNADGPTGQAVPSIVEMQDNVQYLKKSVQLISQVRSLALKSLEFNSFPPQSLLSLAPGQQQSSARRRVAEKDNYSSSGLALLSIRTSPVRVFPLIRP